jgi:O-antigen ligase
LGKIGLLFVGTYAAVALIAGVLSYSDSSVERFNLSIQQRINVAEWIKNTEDTSIGYRYALWGSAVQLWKSNPLFGIGFGQLIEGEYNLYFFAAPIRDVHNNYLGVLVQTGLVGALVLVWWFGKIVLGMLRQRRPAQPLPPVLFFTRASLVLFMVSFAFSVLWDLNSFNIVWWVVLAMWQLEEVTV